MEAIESSSKTKSNKKHIFNAQLYLASGGVARTVVEFQRSEKAYSQGDPATDVLYVQKGGIKLSVVNEAGKEALSSISVESRLRGAPVHKAPHRCIDSAASRKQPRTCSLCSALRHPGKRLK